MRCPHCASSSLVEKVTKQGVLVDHCDRCHGIWLDRGEIYLLSRYPKQLERALGAGADRRPSERCCPRCGAAMEVGSFLDPRLEVDTCPKCGGMWFDQGELKQALAVEQRLFQVELDPLRSREVAAPAVAEETERDPRAAQRLAAVAAGMLPLPNLAIRSASVLLFLYAMLSAGLLAGSAGAASIMPTASPARRPETRPRWPRRW